MPAYVHMPLPLAQLVASLSSAVHVAAFGLHLALPLHPQQPPLLLATADLVRHRLPFFVVIPTMVPPWRHPLSFVTMLVMAPHHRALTPTATTTTTTPMSKRSLILTPAITRLALMVLMPPPATP